MDVKHILFLFVVYFLSVHSLSDFQLHKSYKERYFSHIHDQKYRKLKQNLSEVTCNVVFNTGQCITILHSEYIGMCKSETNLMLLISVLLPCLC